MDWRVVVVAVAFSMWLGALAGTRRDSDRRDITIALVVTFLAGIGTAVFGSGSETAELAAVSLSVGAPVAFATMYAFVRIRS